MAWFKCGGGGIPAALKSLMNAVLNKKWGTSGTYPPETWPETVNLMGPLEEKTVSGSIVTFSDGADDVPLKSCAVTIAPTLDGVSSVDVVQTKKNFVDDTLDGLEQGSISSGTGLNASSTTRVRTADYIPFPLDKIQPSYVLTIPSGYKIAMRFYDKDKNFVTPPAGAQGFINNIPSGYVGEGVEFARFILAKTDDTDITPNDMKNVGFQIEVGSTSTAYEPYITPTTHTANLGRTIYGGSVDVVNGTGTDENGNDFTFTPVPINSRLGDNTMWSDDGDLSVVYRSSGTQTIIQPTLISKTITANGTYSAAADAADGFSSVVVDVPTGATNIETVLGSNALLELTGVSGTDVTRTMWTRTAAQDEKVVFHPNTQVKTNTGANDGYFKVLKNDVVVVSTYANTSTTTSLSIPDIYLEAGDVLTISAGFDNNHSSCWFDLYSTITILSSGSAPVLGLGLGNLGPVNEPEQEEPEEIQEETPEEVDQNESDE